MEVMVDHEIQSEDFKIMHLIVWGDSQESTFDSIKSYVFHLLKNAFFEVVLSLVLLFLGIVINVKISLKLLV